MSELTFEEALTALCKKANDAALIAQVHGCNPFDGYDYAGDVRAAHEREVAEAGLELDEWKECAADLFMLACAVLDGKTEAATMRTELEKHIEHVRRCRKGSCEVELRRERDLRRARADTWREAARLHRDAEKANQSDASVDTGRLWRGTVHGAAAEEFERRAAENEKEHEEIPEPPRRNYVTVPDLTLPESIHAKGCRCHDVCFRHCTKLGDPPHDVGFVDPSCASLRRAAEEEK